MAYLHLTRHGLRWIDTNLRRDYGEPPFAAEEELKTVAYYGIYPELVVAECAHDDSLLQMAVGQYALWWMDEDEDTQALLPKYNVDWLYQDDVWPSMYEGWRVLLDKFYVEMLRTPSEQYTYNKRRYADAIAKGQRWTMYLGGLGCG